MTTATQKKSYASRLGVLAVALTLVTACLLGGTMAKYVTEVTGTGSATVAKWSFTANEKTDKFDVALTDTTQTGVATGKIAPGAKGSFDIDMSAAGSEVGVDYTIAFSDTTNLPAGLKFYSDADGKSEITELSAVSTGTIEADKTEKVTIYWSWPTTGDDSSDTTVGKAANGVAKTFTITVTGKQQTPATPSA